MAGFKSFADAAEIDIESGLTGIVGPNGCGKSNIVEGLRWVMGKALPGKCVAAKWTMSFLLAPNSAQPKSRRNYA